ncbi:unnamed protein product [Adineta steineri]|uniref:NAD(P)(+)--arginine ADP-ribosyltransferase n=1 Tax=Adineta steineri TaxID=433720 RepID=A0A815NWB9_9BILA|nr:unnamed protein product [Adineta steineri]CAF3698238.1 unnamed protein product [Adineta steineri]
MATGGNIDSQQYTRISDIANEPQKMFMPIEGYEEMPIVPLEEAVAPLISILPKIQTYTYVAKQRCESVSPNGLTQDESASVILYSMEWEPHEKCLYFALNAALRTEDRRKLKPWFSYLKLVLTALEKLPSTRCTVFRGVNLNLANQYTEGKTFVWWGFSSCTASMRVLENEQFLGKTGERTMFTIECDSGKDISGHSYFQAEKEVLLLAARQFTVVSCLRPAPGLYMVHLKETKPPITLLQPAINQSMQIKPTPGLHMNQLEETKAPSTLLQSVMNQSVQIKPTPGLHMNQLKETKLPSILLQPATNQSMQIKPTPDLHIIQLKETKPTITLLQPVTNQSVQIKPTPKQMQTKKIKYQQSGITVAGGNKNGHQLNQLDHPCGIFIDNDKSIYIADSFNHRIVKWQLNSNTGQIIAGGNGQGNQNNQLNEPRDIVFDKENNSFLISDVENNRVIRYFDENPTNQQIIISKIYCSRLAIDKNGSIYVSDSRNNEVRRWKQGDEIDEIVAGGNGKGNHLNQLNQPTYIFIDDDYSLYISDTDNHRIMKWKKDAKEGIIVAGGNEKGNSLKQLCYPRGVIVDHLGQIYVADPDNHRVMRWCEGDKEGEIVVGGNSCGNQSNQLNGPMGLSFDNEENLYVVDRRNHRVQKYEKILN